MLDVNAPIPQHAEIAVGEGARHAPDDGVDGHGSPILVRDSGSGTRDSAPRRGQGRPGHHRRAAFGTRDPRELELPGPFVSHTRIGPHVAGPPIDHDHAPKHTRVARWCRRRCHADRRRTERLPAGAQRTSQAAAGLPALQTSEVPARVLTLDTVIDLAEARSEQIAIAQFGVDRALAGEQRARSDRLPQLSGGHPTTVSSSRSFRASSRATRETAGSAETSPTSRSVSPTRSA